MGGGAVLVEDVKALVWEGRWCWWPRLLYGKGVCPHHKSGSAFFAEPFVFQQSGYASSLEAGLFDVHGRMEVSCLGLLNSCFLNPADN